MLWIVVNGRTVSRAITTAFFPKLQQKSDLAKSESGQIVHAGYLDPVCGEKSISNVRKCSFL